jgi:hypothetical protein
MDSLLLVMTLRLARPAPKLCCMHKVLRIAGTHNAGWAHAWHLLTARTIQPTMAGSYEERPSAGQTGCRSRSNRPRRVERNDCTRLT